MLSQVPSIFSSHIVHHPVIQKEKPQELLLMHLKLCWGVDRKQNKQTKKQTQQMQEKRILQAVPYSYLSLALPLTFSHSTQHGFTKPLITSCLSRHQDSALWLLYLVPVVVPHLLLQAAHLQQQAHQEKSQLQWSGHLFCPGLVLSSTVNMAPMCSIGVEPIFQLPYLPLCFSTLCQSSLCLSSKAQAIELFHSVNNQFKTNKCEMLITSATSADHKAVTQK